MSDIVERLRNYSSENFGAGLQAEDWMDEAADEIERLRGLMRDCHHVLHKLMAIVPGNDAAVDEMAKVMKKARAALRKGK
jgi:hypothetical protein